MRKSILQKFGFLAFSMMLIAFMGNAQEKASPAKTAEGTVNGAKITINYSSPAVKGRTIWGDLVPYGKVWRAGANEATTFETDKDIKVEGKDLPAGKYTFFIIPGEEQSTFIFNSETGQWGTNYDESKDVLRVQVQSQESPTMEERLVYEITKSGFEVRWADGRAQASIK
ncbi:MAG TPA: DUF2911 domain-containing protein [Cyclobacteriaceae bacterium]|nr:DUF2911 domain-containing protein [Cyclobacteriaceae bacterium]